MDLESIKRQLDKSVEPVPLPKFKLSQRVNDPVMKIHKTMKTEISVQLTLMAAFLLLFPALLPMQELPFAVYIILMLVTSMFTLCYILRLRNFLRRHIDFNANTHNVLHRYIGNARQTVEAYESYVIAGSALLPISIFALLTGNDYFVTLWGDRLFDQWFLLRQSPGHLAMLLVSYLAIFAAMVWLTKFWTYRCYEKQIEHLESLLNELEDGTGHGMG